MDYEVLFNGTANTPWGRQLFADEYVPTAPPPAHVFRGLADLTAEEKSEMVSWRARRVRPSIIARKYHTTYDVVNQVIAQALIYNDAAAKDQA